MKTHHWHAMNGSTGCLPDNNEIHRNKMDAVKSLVDLFSDTNERGLYTSLVNDEIYHFRNPKSAGADYCEVSKCGNAHCMEDDE